MKEYLTEFDELQDAMRRVNLNESAMPVFNGRVCNDVDSYNKVQKLLNCEEMIECHRYLYDLDLDQLDEDDAVKIGELYDLGVKRGFIQDDLTDWEAEPQPEVNDLTNTQNAENQVPVSPKNTMFPSKHPCWTVIYSAMKDGNIKTGEAYSCAVSTSAAKADVCAKLSRIGYDNVSILAIEACDDDCRCGCKDPQEFGEDDVEENDMLNSRNHNLHVDEDDEESDDSDEGAEEEDDSSDDTSDEGSDDSDEGSEEDSSDEDSEDDSEDDSDEDDSDEEDSDEEDSDEEDSDEEDSDDEDSEDDSDEEDSDDEDSEDDSDEEDSEDEDSDDEDSEDEEEKEELDPNEKAQLKDDYTKVFKNTLIKCKYEKCFDDLTLEEKVKFFTELSKAWKKNEPNEFMTDKQIEQLNKIVAKVD